VDATPAKLTLDHAPPLLAEIGHCWPVPARGDAQKM
jgi:hypothetical protein